MEDREPISVVLIALDEARQIEAALVSVDWADEVVVVDGGSRDGTQQICRLRGAHVVENPFRGFVEQKNFALAQARHNWVLSLDADEQVSPGLQREIEHLRTDGLTEAGYRIPRVTHYLGRFLRTTEWYPDRQLRLFDRRRGSWQGQKVHESVRVDGSVGTLNAELLHYPYRNIEDHLTRMNRYSTLAARQMRESGRAGSFLAALLLPPVTFLKNYLIKGGFRDGWAGLTVSLLNSLYVFLKYLKVWELDRRGETTEEA